MMTRVMPFQLIAGACVGFFCLQNTALASDYTHPISGISAHQKLEHKIGEAIFQKLWVPAPSSTTASDGLGPLYNARSCQNCHVNNGRGHAPEAHINGASVPSFVVRLGKNTASASSTIEGIFPHIGDSRYGHQFQHHNAPGIEPEGDYHLTYLTQIETFDDGTTVELRQPKLHWNTLNYGKLDALTGHTLLVSPPLVGMGLLDHIPDDVILANSDPDDLDNDGISGRPNRILIDGNIQLGRFGYKATTARLSEQNQQAFNIDLGLSTPILPNASGDCTVFQQGCVNSPNGNSVHLDNLEVDRQQMRLVNVFIALSAPPAMRRLQDPSFLAGKRLFDQGRCASCHTPKMHTGENSTFQGLNNRTFYPFTDMLLHDMGEGLASGFPAFSAQPREWRTAPLWGIGLSETVSKRQGFLHDGRARTLEEAILWHGGEAQPSQQFYKALNSADRKTLIHFLESL
ncbi:di-heme oxidoredictase family protein [Marinomonas sp. IMCC 4694]|uniref:di-heme oxidoreductase family protein n=1 Tax=Marinomonas sp. IMCC 4694 TaxID=2605432 RepID=UPI0011E70328|nr:di-heme oxidoredictase family protein [Marinomonas sp. IMCC 4694]TYL47708.1 c-type cytochrome [Marinomonas sp. IMCC 4694]